MGGRDIITPMEQVKAIGNKKGWSPALQVSAQCPACPRGINVLMLLMDMAMCGYTY